MLKQRIITAIILIPLLIWGILALPPIWFAFLVAVVMAAGAWEWAKLVGLSKPILRFLYMAFIIIGILLAIRVPVLPILILGFIAWLWAAVVVVSFAMGESPLGMQYQSVQSILGFFTLIPCAIALIVIRDFSRIGPPLLLYALFIIWAADTGAYFAGRAWGKRRLAVKVSPNKTWEGLLGGLILTLIVAIIFSLFLSVSWPERIGLWGLSLATFVFALFGDLLISVLKRLSGMKDTGQILPGHGGILDRIDSTLAATVIFALGSLWL